MKITERKFEFSCKKIVDRGWVSKSIIKHIYTIFKKRRRRIHEIGK